MILFYFSFISPTTKSTHILYWYVYIYEGYVRQAICLLQTFIKYFFESYIWLAFQNAFGFDIIRK